MMPGRKSLIAAALIAALGVSACSTVGGAVKHKYHCRSSHCDGRPGSSSQWEKSGRCR